ncbi:MAG: hypothetical protein GYA15_03420 [Leptolinea sp.]|jgi:hypothetical protein|nr:hypothetical protein [Leptolinea sp.]
MKNNRFPSRLDGLLIALLALAGIWLAAASAGKPVHPAEDAAMLMRYSQHLAQGHGIVWNIGQPPVDGATDFLFMLTLAGLYALGGGLESSVLWLGGISHLMTVLLVYVGIRRFFKGGILAALISAVFLLCGPGLRYVEAGFGTTFFALFCALSWLAGRYALEKPGSTGRALSFAVSCLLMGLIRPEGVLIAGFMLLGIIAKNGWKKSARLTTIFAGVFLLLGGAYFLWRWNYFGYPLPNPFYKKGGGNLYFDSLREAVFGLFELSFPFWLVYAVCVILAEYTSLERSVFIRGWWMNTRDGLNGFLQSESRGRLVKTTQIAGGILVIGFILGLFRPSSSLHETLVLGRYSTQYAGFLLALLMTGLAGLTISGWLPVYELPDAKKQSVDGGSNTFLDSGLVLETLYAVIPILGFTLMWVLLSNEMNTLYRFQYPILPIVLMTWPLLMDVFCQSIKMPDFESWPSNLRGAALLAVLLLGIGLVWTQAHRWTIDYRPEGRYEVAEFLAQYADRQYTIATTEAGLLPLYSGWQAVDTWGLNDAWIAHNDGITAEYLEKAHPEIIMFHAYFSPIYPLMEAGDAWGRMTLMLDTYAREKGYTLAAAYGESPVDTHYYYVRPDFPESGEIVTFIRSLDGGRYHYGARTLDYNKLLWKKDK